MLRQAGAVSSARTPRLVFLPVLPLGRQHSPVYQRFCPRTLSFPGGGAFRSFSASSWLEWDCIFDLRSVNRQFSRRSKKVIQRPRALSVKLCAHIPKNSCLLLDLASPTPETTTFS